jgi:DNA-binding MarR family transcriptional regulator
VNEKRALETAGMGEQAASPKQDQSELDAAYSGPPLPDHQPELKILQSLRRIIRAVDTHSRSLSGRFGITGPQLVCLTTLCDGGPMTGAELSRRVFVSASTITGIIDRLEKSGYVQRRRDAVDRRRVLLPPTEAGHELAENVPSPLQERFVERLRDLPEPDRKEISGALERVVELMEAHEIDASPILTTGDIGEHEPESDKQTV